MNALCQRGRAVLTTTVWLCMGLLAGPASADLTVAVAGPMTGGEAAFGAQFKAGAELAVKDLNAKGGVLGQQLKLVISDDFCDPKQAVAAAHQLVDQGVQVVVGHFCSGCSIPASLVYSEAKLLQISPGSTAPAFTDGAARRGHHGVLRVCGRTDQQGAVAGAYLAAKYQGKNVAIVHDGTPYAKSLADGTKVALNAAGLTEKLFEAITPGEPDYSALVAKLKDAAIDAVFYGGYYREAGLLVRQMRAQSLGTQLVSGNAIDTKQFWETAGAAGEGTLMTQQVDAATLPSAADVVNEFKARGVVPEGYTLYAYAAFQVFAQAARAAGSTDLDKVAPVLRNTTFKTVLGALTFDQKGDPIGGPKYTMYVWKSGVAELLAP